MGSNVDSRMRMAKRQSKSQPTWTDVKAILADLDRAALLGLIQSLYTAHKDNQMFLHARFGLGEDVLEPWPDDLMLTEPPSVSDRLHCQEAVYTNRLIRPRSSSPTSNSINCLKRVVALSRWNPKCNDTDGCTGVRRSSRREQCTESPPCA